MKDTLRTTFPIGMGCWAIGGPFFHEDAPLGWGDVDDDESIDAVHAAYDCGVRVFDTAAVYGAGHSERVLGRALARRHDGIVVTKLGLKFDESSRQLLGPDSDPSNVGLAIEQSLRRLQRERIDVMLLHLNDLPVDAAEPLFDEMDKAVEQGKVGSLGWSTDYPDRIDAVGNRPNFIAVEHCLNVFVDTPTMQQSVAQNDLIALIRSPLAMGVLTGKYTAHTRFSDNDNRARDEAWRDYFVDAAVDPVHLANLEAVRDCLTVGGRSLTQGALAWIMARSSNNLPIPGARTRSQIMESAGAVEFGPLQDAVMREIENLIVRRPEGEPRDR